MRNEPMLTKPTWLNARAIKTLPLEPIGKRIGRLRLENGWTQQALAVRLSISRVAISHIEMDISVPSERTITLLAGIFKFSPLVLVEGTTYPQAKIERLPHVACCYTRLELELALLENDLAWLKSITGSPIHAKHREIVQKKWSSRFLAWSEELLDEREKEIVTAGQKKLVTAT